MHCGADILVCRRVEAVAFLIWWGRHSCLPPSPGAVAFSIWWDRHSCLSSSLRVVAFLPPEQTRIRSGDRNVPTHRFETDKNVCSTQDNRQEYLLHPRRQVRIPAPPNQQTRMSATPTAVGATGV